MTYLIVGASSGLGRDLAYEFAKNSKNLILVSRDKKDLEHLKSDIEIKYKVQVDIFELDFSYQNNITNFISEKKDIIKSFDGVLFPIGMMLDDDTVKNTDEKLNKLISANFYCVANFISKILNVFEEKFEQKIKKLKSRFEIIHLHGNNNDGMNNGNLPVTLEVTLVNKNYINEKNEKKYNYDFPIKNLDFPNNPSKADLAFSFE